MWGISAGRVRGGTACEGPGERRLGRLLAISRTIDAINAKFGVIAIYLVLFAALLLI